MPTAQGKVEVDEIRQIYEDNEFDKERFEMLSLIGEADTYFAFCNDDDDDGEEAYDN